MSEYYIPPPFNTEAEFVANYAAQVATYLMATIKNTDSLNVKVRAATELVLLLRRFRSVLPESALALLLQVLDGVACDLQEVGRNWLPQLLVHCGFEPGNTMHPHRAPSIN